MKLVLSLDRFAFRRLTRARGRDARLRNVFTYAKRLPLGIARSQALFAQFSLLVSGYLVVAYADALTAANVLLVLAHHRVRGCAGASEEIEDDGFGLISYKET